MVARMQLHFSQCQPAQEETEDETPEVQIVNYSESAEASSSNKSTASPISDEVIPMFKKQTISGGKMDAFVTRASKIDKETTDRKMAHFRVAPPTTPFSAVGHPEFVKLIQLLRPGYNPPNAFQVAGNLLDEVCNSLLSQCKDILRGTAISLSLVGWSNAK